MTRRLRHTKTWTVKLTAGPMSRTMTVEAPSAGAAIQRAAEYVEDTAWVPCVAWPR